jgi:hypothetical protein
VKGLRRELVCNHEGTLASKPRSQQTIIVPSIVAIIAIVLLDFRRDNAEFSLPEATIKSLHTALFGKKTTCLEVVNEYINRINTYDNKLHSIAAINPHARERAIELDGLPIQEKVRQSIDAYLRNNCVYSVFQYSSKTTLICTTCPPPQAPNLWSIAPLQTTPLS